MRIRKDTNFVSCFNEKTGEYVRSGIVENGIDTGIEPFMASFPELLDIGIMGHCLHGKFEEILRMCAKFQIVPNFTTSGLGMTKEIAQLCEKYCGAVAVSWYRSKYTIEAIEMLVKAGVKTNIHYVLHKNSISEAIQRLKEKTFPEGINAVIFLLHKPVGLGTAEKIIDVGDEKFWELIKYITEEKIGYKVGF